MAKQKKKKVDKNIGLESIKERIDKKLTDDRRAMAMSLYNELVFMSKTLDKLKEDINNNGVVENFKNGKQDFIRESQALKSYNNTIKNYNKCIKDLLDIVPPKDKWEDEEDEDNFFRL